MAEKEATVYIVDLNRSMRKKNGGRDQSDLDWSLRYIWDRITTTVNTGRKTATLGVIGLGTDESDNPLSEDEGYENISVLHPISQILLPDIRALQERLKHSSTHSGDAISAIVLAIHMIEKHCKQNQWMKEIVVVTNGMGSMDTEMSEDIAKKIRTEHIKLTILGVDFDDAEFGFKEENKQPAKSRNERTLQTLADACDGTFGTMREAIEWLSVPRLKKIRPTVLYRGQLTLGDPKNHDNVWSIDIERYAKTMIAKPPTASAFALRQDGASQADGMERVRNQYKYEVDDDNPDGMSNKKKEVERDELSRGFEYGRTAVPIGETEENITKLETEQGYEILGFIPQENVERYLIMDRSNMIVGQKTNDKAILALSSLIRALHELDTCAVARVVQKDMMAPSLTLLSPSIEEDFECLVENALPFAEDLRSYRFPSLDKVLTVSGKSLESHRNLPSDSLQSAMDKFVDSMDLVNYDGEEYMTMDSTFSPVLHRIQDSIKWRAVHPSEGLPPVPETLIKYSKPPPGLPDQKILQMLIKAADVKKVPPRVKGRRRFREAEKPLSGLDIESLFRKEKRTVISPDNAIPEFKQTMQIATEDQVIEDAMKQMAAIVEDQIRHSFGDSRYQRALEGIGVMRQEMVELEMPVLYNNMLREMKRKMLAEELGVNRREMWYLIRRNRMGLIDTRVSASSDVTPEDAEAFMRA